MRKLINIDNGGTLTDFCLTDGNTIRFTKTLTTSNDLSACFFEGLKKLAQVSYGEADVGRLLQETDYIRYSTTQGTNALVQRRGPRLGLIVSAESSIELLTKDPQEASLFSALVADRVRVLQLDTDVESIDRQLTEIVNELSASGSNRIVVSLDAENAIDPERNLERIILRRYPSHLLGAVPVSFAASLNQDPDFCRRTWSTLFNEFLHPSMEHFLYGAEHRLKDHHTRNPLLIFRNDGGSARVAKTIALKTYSSGPRGGIEGAKALASYYRMNRLLSLDVGGTTTDICLIESGEAQQDHYGKVEGLEVSIPLCRIHSNGVGGSSVICTKGNKILVGPNSVGAVPGPACFGRGGTALTITDVSLLNGLIDQTTYFGGELDLDHERANNALVQAITQPLGVNKAEALIFAEQAWVDKIIASIRGAVVLDNDVVLAGFGGSGPMLLTKIAEGLGLKKALIPGMAPVFSAFGIGFSDVSQHYQVDVGEASKKNITAESEKLIRHATRDMFAEKIPIKQCEMNWSLVNPSGDGEVFDWQPEKAIPSALPNTCLLRLEVKKEIDKLQLRESHSGEAYPAESALTRTITFNQQKQVVPLYKISELNSGAEATGPCVIEDDYFTARIDQGWHFSVSPNADLILNRLSYDA